VKIYLLLLLFIFSATSFGETSKGSIIINVNKLRTSKGIVKIHLFDKKEGFPTEGKRSMITVYGEIQNNKATVTLKEIPFGTYAICILHDEDKSGFLETNWLGIPIEGYGFSNDASAFLSAPSFEKASFKLKEQKLTVNITANYM
jgi:uncharacterized protein (DUF2141 family)